MELESKEFSSHICSHLTVDTFVTRVLIIHLDFGLPPQDHVRVGGRLIRVDSHRSSDSSVEMSDELASTLASIQEFMAGVSRRLDQIESSRQDHHPVGISTDDTVPHVPQTAQVFPPGTSHGVPFHLSDHCETAPPPFVSMSPPMVLTIEDTRLAGGQG
ncbi:hypothetical protein AAG906_000652 [Vitis piasezkii]